jgi:hypothetical protein
MVTGVMPVARFAGAAGEAETHAASRPAAARVNFMMDGALYIELV